MSDKLEKQVDSLNDRIRKTSKQANKRRLKGYEALKKVQNLDDDFPFHKHEDPLHPSEHTKGLSHEVDKSFHDADDLDSQVEKLREERDKLLSDDEADEQTRKEKKTEDRELERQKKAIDAKDSRKLKRAWRGHERPLPDLSAIEIQQIRQQAEEMAFEDHYLEKLAMGGVGGRKKHTGKRDKK